MKIKCKQVVLTLKTFLITLHQNKLQINQKKTFNLNLIMKLNLNNKCKNNNLKNKAGLILVDI